MKNVRSLLVLLALLAAHVDAADFDLLVRGGELYDGTGSAPRRADLGIRGDRIVAIGDLSKAHAPTVIDATGLAVAPGFINMLSWSTDTLIADGRSQGELRQGVTTEVMGEGWSMGPWTAAIKERERREQGDIKFEIQWTTLREYLDYMQKRGIAPNIASYVGATTIREHVVGLENRPPTPVELDAMRALVRRAMEEGALGIGSSLIYAPASYASTEELIELCKVAAKYQGKYISHIRSEGDRLVEAVDELIRIAREAQIPAEIYHLKAAGEANWGKLDTVIAHLEAARKAGLHVTADMYTYTAGSTGFNACIPTLAQQGGYDGLYARIRDPKQRAEILAEMKRTDADWENLCHAAGTPDRLLLVDFKSDALKPLTGKTLAEVMQMRGSTDPDQTILDLVLEDQSRVGVVFFLMSEDNVRKQLRLPWVSFGSDAGSMAPEGVFLKSSTHPRAYGNFVRLLGHYVRDEKLIPMAQAIHRLSGLPATNLGLKDRGFLRQGGFADVVVFDPARVADTATYAQPHQYAVGVRHVLVNGVPVLKDGEHTGATPGRVLLGPGAVR